ncbi:WsbH protein [Sulfitobacter noctilucicola]|uniref:Glycosyltransferase subfamily 4-like N-terminal domain-containing protein n=1 Tax=Sulfitobacter noctilucicola TaxID=1342301 RepID=A0A7W6MAF8_9RHOB|nr:glycosyltransferase [Sulfitobacter noctilucicola]KIN64101.1 WsbH protein [Sulfitobacter noctilucicola]MBB4175455.1 hypothetical protein [Sulfitobacter noctilucicola]
MKALLCTHHFDTWSGSELVLLELAEALNNAGWDVEIFCPFQRDGFLDAVLGTRFYVYKSAEDVADLTGFELVYIQHSMHSRFLAVQPMSSIFGVDAPTFVYNHLSPHEPFESPMTASEAVLADLVCANSPETADRYKPLGAPFDHMIVMPNPAPMEFESARRPRYPGRLKRLLVVSNHVPPEVIEAITLLQDEGVVVERVGMQHESRRIIPSDLALTDAVLTIGKTVQYALRAGCPVYIYDHFGGGGWLTPAGFASAEATNFSGRDCAQTKTAQTLREELSELPPKALEAVENCPERFCLEYWVEKIAQTVASKEKKNAPAIPIQALELEKKTVDHIDFLFSEVRRFRTAYQRSSAKNKVLREQLEKFKKAKN